MPSKRRRVSSAASPRETRAQHPAPSDEARASACADPSLPPSTALEEPILAAAKLQGVAVNDAAAILPSGASEGEHTSCISSEAPLQLEPIAAGPSQPAPVGFPLRHVCGPMVGASDLAFRLLCRRHGADVCYTEMLFASRFTTDPSYRDRKLQSCAADRPLVVQFCGNDPQVIAEAAALAAPFCDAIDLNLGCPLPQAHEGNFGASLLQHQQWDRVSRIVSTVGQAVTVPIFCKIRLLDDINETVKLAKLLEASGCAALCVHGRCVPDPLEHRHQRQVEAVSLMHAEVCNTTGVSCRHVPLLAVACRPERDRVDRIGSEHPRHREWKYSTRTRCRD